MRTMLDLEIPQSCKPADGKEESYKLVFSKKQKDANPKSRQDFIARQSHKPIPFVQVAWD
ncbi:hypothetical protein TUMSATVNIG3_56010 (plasmid) [Vibrio nigripulchritudo]|nr:hypothetical protein TUMSATVNIG2_55320 [Vibrio nigripulchritudo]BDU46803.1 hypothetical protein TUMSATVNIG3_56010 [Vibrio nigripulchritudo]